MKNIINIAIIAVCNLIALGVCQIARRAFGARPELSRKVAHVLACLSSLAIPCLLDGHLPLLALAAGFSLLLAVLKRFDRFPALFGVRRKSAGAVLMCWGIYLAFLFAARDPFAYASAILVLAFADTAASLPSLYFAGERSGKTTTGSLAFFVASAITLFPLGLSLGGLPPAWALFDALAVSIAATLVERVSSGGSDNVTVPLVVVALRSIAAHSAWDFALAAACVSLVALLMLFGRHSAKARGTVARVAIAARYLVKRFKLLVYLPASLFVCAALVALLSFAREAAGFVVTLAGKPIDFIIGSFAGGMLYAAFFLGLRLADDAIDFERDMGEGKSPFVEKGRIGPITRGQLGLAAFAAFALGTMAASVVSPFAAIAFASASLLVTLAWKSAWAKRVVCAAFVAALPFEIARVWM